jgi:hypothetical protein
MHQDIQTNIDKGKYGLDNLPRWVSGIGGKNDREALSLNITLCARMGHAIMSDRAG